MFINFSTEPFSFGFWHSGLCTIFPGISAHSSVVHEDMHRACVSDRSSWMFLFQSIKVKSPNKYQTSTIQTSPVKSSCYGLAFLSTPHTLISCNTTLRVRRLSWMQKYLFFTSLPKSSPTLKCSFLVISALTALTAITSVLLDHKSKINAAANLDCTPVCKDSRPV